MTDVHRATIDWDGAVLDVAVLALGDRPLLGTALLDGYHLSVDFVAGGDVRIQSFP
jgi:predicted aspartyl protease